MKAKLHSVFVYGTLKSPYWNHRLIEHGGGKFLGVGMTKEKFLLFDGGIPYVINPPDPTVRLKLGRYFGQIKGEVYQVDDPTLAALDRLEGHPNGYRRESTRCKLLTDEGKVRAYIRAGLYFYQRSPGGTMVVPSKGVLDWVPMPNRYASR
jgi:gamma-glutamylaminecyclotransferase